jgi:hypothetical protein
MTQEVFDKKNKDTRLQEAFVLDADGEIAIKAVLVEGTTDDAPAVNISEVGGASVPTVGTQKVLPAAVYDSSGEQVNSFGGIATDAQDVAGSDATIYTGVVGFKAMADGSIKVTTSKGEQRTIQVFEGVMEPIAITKYFLTDSTVMNIRLYYK